MKKNKISLATYVVCLIILAIIVGVLFFFISQNNSKNNSTNTLSNANNLSNNTSSAENVVATEEIEEADKDNYFILYNGYEMEPKTGVQFLLDMQINSKNTEKYNTKYYNYEKGKYVGESKGTFGEETYEGMSIVEGVKRIAISKKYEAIPRNYSTTQELPEELIEMADYTSVNIDTIDLDGDGKQEHIVCYTLNYAKDEIGDGEPKASSGIMLFDSNYKKIADLVNLENGFWADIKEEDRKIFLSLDDVDYIDIDNDEIMEIIIKVPTYEGTKISTIKYNKGEIEGETNLEASVLP